jgi:two-component system, NtrC family, response regulator HydG
MKESPILIVEDDDSMCGLLKQVLEKAGYTNITTAGDGLTAMRLLQSRTFKLVLLNVGIPKPNGIEVLRFIKKMAPSTNVIMISGMSDELIIAAAMELGALTYMKKPIKLDELLSIIESIK